LIDRLINRLIDWLIDRWIDWLTEFETAKIATLPGPWCLRKTIPRLCFKSLFGLPPTNDGRAGQGEMDNYSILMKPIAS